MGVLSCSGRFGRKYTRSYFNHIVHYLMKNRFADMMYSSEGKATMERLWSETLVELEFAGVKDILNSMHRR